MKLDPEKVAWIVDRKGRGAPNSKIAAAMGVSVRRVQELWSAYRATGRVPELRRPGRKRVETSEEERETILAAQAKYEVNALALERVIDIEYRRHIPRNRIHSVLKATGLARDEQRKQLRRRWVRYERKYSNSMWHTDWTLIDGKGWLIAYLDDASRCVVGWGPVP